MSSNWIKGAITLNGERVLVGLSGTPFLGGGMGRVPGKAVGEGGTCHRWGVTPIGPVPVEVTFGPSTSTTQSFKSNKLDFRPRLGGDREGERKSLALNECTLFNGLGCRDGAMVEMASTVGGIGSSRMFVTSPGVLVSSMSDCPKSLIIFGFDWCEFWSLRASKADILDWMDVERDMINLCKRAQSCHPHPLPKNCTPSQVFYELIACSQTSVHARSRLLSHPNRNWPRPFRTSLEGQLTANCYINLTCCRRNRSRNTSQSVNVYYTSLD